MFKSALDAAFRYADLGWPVFPCKPDKRPFTDHGFKDATTDHAQIVAWWREWPEAQIGVACGAAGVCVIDLDMGSGKDGIAAFSRLADEHGPHWCGLIASTPRGGRHMVYLMPADPIPNGQDIVEKQSGIDVRGDGGYIVVPSPSSPGREWITGDPFDINTGTGESDLVQMPEWVERIARGGRRKHQASPAGTSAGMVMPDAQVAAIKRALQFIDADPRDTWIRVGMALKSTGAVQAYDLWSEWSATSPRFSTFDPRVHDRQWASLREFFFDGHEVTIATLFHLAKLGGYQPSLEDELTAEHLHHVGTTEAFQISASAGGPPINLTTVDSGMLAAKPLSKRRPFPRELMNVPGLVGDIAAWLLDSSTRQQPAMCLASSIATMGAVLGRRVATPTDLRTNVYCLGIGETACGKDPGVRLPQLLLSRAGLHSLVGPGEWKSDSGLRAALLDAPSHVALVDEFTKTLAALSGPKIPAHLQGIKRYLLELWAASNSVHLSPAYANRQLNKPVTIEQPNLCLYGTGVPEELFSSLDRGALKDGFLNRILVFFADDQLPPRRRIGRAEPPEDLVARLVALEKTLAAEAGNLAMLPTANAKARLVKMSQAAEDLLENVENENEARIVSMREGGEPLSDLWVRTGAHVAKLALIRTVADDHAREIQMADVCWARDLVLWCLERTMAEAESRVADSQQEALLKRVLRVIVTAGQAGLSGSDLTRRTQWLRRSDRKDILATLIESGDVIVSVAPTGTKPVTVYLAARFATTAEAAAPPATA